MADLLQIIQLRFFLCFYYVNLVENTLECHLKGAQRLHLRLAA